MPNGPVEQDQITGTSSPGELLRWRSLPARRSATRTLAVVAVILGLPAMLAVWYGPFYGGLGILILGGSLMPFFLPTEYTLTDEHVHRRYLGIDQRRRWSEFRSFYPDRNGVLLSPFPLPSRLENFRGMYVRFEHNRDAVLEIVRKKISLGEDA